MMKIGLIFIMLSGSLQSHSVFGFRQSYRRSRDSEIAPTVFVNLIGEVAIRRVLLQTVLEHSKIPPKGELNDSG